MEIFFNFWWNGPRHESVNSLLIMYYAVMEDCILEAEFKYLKLGIPTTDYFFFPKIMISFGITGCWNTVWKTVAYKWIQSKIPYFTHTDLKTRFKCCFQKEHFSVRMLLLSHFHRLMHIILILLVSLWIQTDIQT